MTRVVWTTWHFPAMAHLCRDAKMDELWHSLGNLDLVLQMYYSWCSQVTPINSKKSILNTTKQPHRPFFFFFFHTLKIRLREGQGFSMAGYSWECGLGTFFSCWFCPCDFLLFQKVLLLNLCFWLCRSLPDSWS